MYKSLLARSDPRERQYKYMVTIRKFQVKAKVLLDEIHSVLHYIKEKHPSIVYKQTVYEIDPKYGQLHAHSIVYISEKIVFASISKCGSFRIYWRPIFDLKGARRYLSKVVKTQEIQKEILKRNFNN